MTSTVAVGAVMFATLALAASTPALAQCVPGTTCSMYRDGQCVEHTTTTCVPIPDPSIYGAIAYGPDSDRYGYSFNYTSRGGAEVRARRECGESDCLVAAWFYNRCGALATSSGGAWGGSDGASQPSARSNALRICANHGGTDCEIRISLCSPQ